MIPTLTLVLKQTYQRYVHVYSCMHVIMPVLEIANSCYVHIHRCGNTPGYICVNAQQLIFCISVAITLIPEKSCLSVAI